MRVNVYYEYQESPKFKDATSKHGVFDVQRHNIKYVLCELGNTHLRVYPQYNSII